MIWIASQEHNWKNLHCDTIDVQTPIQGWDLLTLQKLLCRVKGDTSPQYGKQIHFWKTVSQPGAYIDGIIWSHYSMSARDGWRYQNGWIFGKVPNGLFYENHLCVDGSGPSVEHILTSLNLNKHQSKANIKEKQTSKKSKQDKTTYWLSPVAGKYRALVPQIWRMEVINI